ncbi:MAG: efflux RND transporter permease subunit [Alphaproteobacteria bacterium]|jgi:multidrug efflux pump|nr:efflux RND transporter permease subunit [Alphaproteobacteria bacterium]
MVLSDFSVTRPVFASVISLLLIAFGIVAFTRLPLREYPDIDPPVVTINTSYPGASASIVETRVTELIEDRIAGVEGINFIESSSSDGQSRVTLEFNIDRDIEAAANDVRDRIAGIVGNLPEEADPPEVQKVDASDDVIIWLSLISASRTTMELTDYAERYLVDRFSILDGVASVRVGGGQSYAMRVWIDRSQLAARGLTVEDVENALHTENVELPAGSFESIQRQFTVRIDRTFRTEEDFRKLVLARGENGYLVRLGDVARVEKSTVENRVMYRGNGSPRVGLGIIKQSTGNTIEVARQAREQAERINETLPEDMKIEVSYDTSVFIDKAVHEVYVTLGIAMGLVVLVIYAFLGSLRATLVPAVAVPVSLIATFMVLYALGFTINLLTLLALVLAIGLVVDDAIVVLENVVRRMREENEPPLLAAYRGTRQVGFAVVATTLVLVAVFVPITFLEGDVGRLFSEFAVTLAAAVSFSGLVALTLTPMLASKILRQKEKNDGKKTLVDKIDDAFIKVRLKYVGILTRLIERPVIVIAVFSAIIAGIALLYIAVPEEYTPREDRGAFTISVNGPEGASFAYMKDYMDEIEKRLLTYVENGEMETLLVRAPGGFGGGAGFNSGTLICVLADWGKRRSAWDIMDEVRVKLSDLPGVRVAPVMRQGFAGGGGKPVQFVIGGGTYQQLTEWRDTLVAKINENNPGLISVDWNYKETKPLYQISIDYDRAAELGVTVVSIGRTLETLLGSRRITTYIDQGEEYDVIVEGERSAQRTATNMENIYVRSDRSDQLIPLANLVKIDQFADSRSLSRYNRVRAITIDADLEQGYTLGEALTYLETLVRENLPEDVIIDYKGQSQDYKYSGGSVFFVFILGILVMFLVMAAQFESYIHPFVIILTVPLAVAGGLLGLYVTGNTLNLFSQIGMIMLVGLAAKNGILIVEFANQLRDEGEEFNKALLKAAELRLRPILMTSITAAMGAVPLMLSGGAGSETRSVIATVVLSGVCFATVFTLFIVPVAYRLLARHTGSPGDVRRALESQEQNNN